MSHVQDTKKRKRTPSPSSHRPQKQQTTLNYRVLPPLPIPILPQPTPPKRHPIKSTLGSIHNYACHQIISEGEFGLVFFATRGVKKFAIKKLKLTEQDRRSGIYKREFHTLMRLKHPNVVRLYEVATNQRDQLFLVFDYHEYDLKRLLVVSQTLPVALVKNLLKQACAGLQYVHSKRIIHRDLKPSNLLLDLKDGILRIADFGSSVTEENIGRLTPQQVTLWYRAPEILLGSVSYTTAVDMWSLGCIFAELLTGRPLFNARTEIDQIHKIFEILGSPNPHVWPGFDILPLSCTLKFQPQPSSLKETLPNLCENAWDLLQKLLLYEPSERISAEMGLNHPYFQESPILHVTDPVQHFPLYQFTGTHQ